MDTPAERGLLRRRAYASRDDAPEARPAAASRRWRFCGRANRFACAPAAFLRPRDWARLQVGLRLPGHALSTSRRNAGRARELMLPSTRMAPVLRRVGGASTARLRRPHGTRPHPRAARTRISPKKAKTADQITALFVDVKGPQTPPQLRAVPRRSPRNDLAALSQT